VLQGVALFLYLLFDGLASLYVISALFGLFQGGIVPMYAIIVRENFGPGEAGLRKPNSSSFWMVLTLPFKSAACAGAKATPTPSLIPRPAKAW
jgi:hypothetical protein